jgi:hypothetical protein
VKLVLARTPQADTSFRKGIRRKEARGKVEEDWEKTNGEEKREARHQHTG